MGIHWHLSHSQKLGFLFLCTSEATSLSCCQMYWKAHGSNKLHAKMVSSRKSTRKQVTTPQISPSLAWYLYKQRQALSWPESCHSREQLWAWKLAPRWQVLQSLVLCTGPWGMCAAPTLKSGALLFFFLPELRCSWCTGWRPTVQSPALQHPTGR